MNDRDAAIQRRGVALVELVQAELPREFEVTGDADAWPLVGAGLLSRMTTTLHTVLSIQSHGREADAGTLVRELFEHAVFLAWLAADPGPARIEEWRKHDLKARLTADTDARSRGVELFSEVDRAALEAQIDGMTGARLVLADVAVIADSYWAGKLPGMGGQTDIQSFRGLYGIVYRMYSGYAHPTYRGLNLVVEDLSGSRKRVVLEQRYEGNGPYGLATVIFAVGLYVAADSIGWPAADDISGVFDRFPARESM